MQLTEADAWVRHHICDNLHWNKVKKLGVAVSGGGDSVALLHLLAHGAAERGLPLAAATVDHGLRAEAADEAAFVAETCATLGVRHETLHWRGWDGQGNLQARAREARYALLAGWALEQGLDTVALGHTLDDQAETFLMRLKREAGVDGLAAMDRVFSRDGARFWRPALTLERAELRGFLTRHGLDWRDDPSNRDERFDRVKMRKALIVLEELGIDKGVLSGVALNLASASHALARHTADAADRIARVEAGDVVFDSAQLLAIPPETMRRLLIAALNWVSGAPYGPRRETLRGLERAIVARKTRNLHGCLVLADKDQVRVTREYAAVKDTVAPTGALWDGRWRLTGKTAESLEIRALGEAVKDCEGWRDTGLPRASLIASPAIWLDDRLIAAPIAGFSNGWSADIAHSPDQFFTSALSH